MSLLKIILIAITTCIICHANVEAVDIQELKEQITKSNELGTSRVDLYNKLSWKYKSSDIDSAKYYAHEALSLSQKISYAKGVATSMQLLGIYSKYQYDYPKSISFFQQSIPYYRQLSDTTSIAILYENMANAYRDINQNDTALIYYLKGLKIFEQKKELPSIARLKNNIGIAYQNMKDYDQAFEFYKESLQLQLINNTIDSIEISRVTYNLGIISEKRNQLDSSLYYYQTSLTYRKALGDSTRIMEAYNGLGRTHQLLGNYDRSEYYLRARLEYYIRLGDKKRIAHAYNNLGNLQHYQGKFEQAINHRRKALILNEELQEEDFTKIIFEGLVESYKALGMYDSALYYTDKYIEIQNRLYNVQRDSVVAEIREAYESEKKQQTIDILEERNKRRKQWITGISIISALSVMLLGVGIFNYRRKQKDQQQLLEQKEEIMVQKEKINRQVLVDLVKEQEIEIKDSIRIAEQKERNRIAYELHEGVQNDMAFSIISLEMIGEKLKEYLISQNLWDDYLESVSMIRHTKEDVRLLSHNLRSEYSYLGSWLHVIKNLCNFLDEKSHIRIHLQTHNLKDVHISSEKANHITRILQELLNNILKHSEATEVHLEISHHDEHLHILLKDNGKGFDIEKTHEGVGIKHMRARAESMNGTFDIQSTPGLGTEIELVIPVDQVQILA